MKNNKVKFNYDSELIAERLVDARNDSNLTQAQVVRILREECNISITTKTLQNYENPKSNKSKIPEIGSAKLVAFSKIYNKPIEYLLGQDRNKKNNVVTANELMLKDKTINKIKNFIKNSRKRSVLFTIDAEDVEDVVNQINIFNKLITETNVIEKIEKSIKANLELKQNKAKVFKYYDDRIQELKMNLKSLQNKKVELDKGPRQFMTDDIKKQLINLEEEISNCKKSISYTKNKLNALKVEIINALRKDEFEISLEIDSILESLLKKAEDISIV